MKPIDRDLLLCTFLFLLLLGIYLATKDAQISTLMVGFGGATMMGLKVGMGVSDTQNKTISTPIAESSPVTSKE